MAKPIKHGNLFKVHAQHIAFLRRLFYLLLCFPLLANGSEISPTHTSKGRPSLDQAANGIPVINIQNPNNKGVSQNFYQRFNIDTQGAILNNNRTLHSTQLGGYIEGNPNLKNGSAKLILNEVISTNSSSLNGYLEVGGASADVIIANPNGITCNGCGFINTNRATLTTGKPLLDEAGYLRHFSVDNGKISIIGNGVNASNTDRFDIIARSVELAAELHATELNIITGQQEVNSQTLETLQQTTDHNAPAFAIDSTLLGGIYADQIRLVANEKGVGVNLDMPVAAQNGSLTLTADGKIQLVKVSAANNITINSQNSVSIQDTAAATNALTIDSQTLAINGQQVSGKNITIHTEETTVNEAASLFATERLNLHTTQLENKGEIASHQNIRISGDDNTPAETITNKGSIFAEGLVLISAETLKNESSSSIEAQQAVWLEADAITNYGSIFGQYEVDLVASHLTNQALTNTEKNDGIIASLGNLFVTADNLDNLNGALIGSGDYIQLLIENSLNNTQSTIHAKNTLLIGAAPKKATTQDEESENTESANSDNVNEEATPSKTRLVINRNGQISTDSGDITIFAETLDNSRHVAVEKSQNLSAYDLMEANWLALQDDDPSNNLINLIHDNATLSEDDLLFIFDAGVYTLPLFVTYGGQFQEYVDAWLTNYINYLNKNHKAQISSGVTQKIRKQLVGTIEQHIRHTFNGQYEYYDYYTGTSESSSHRVKGAPTPLGESIWIIARTAQLIKEYAPDTYDQLQQTLINKLKNDYSTLNVWKSTCGQFNGDNANGCDNGYVRFFQFSDERYDDLFTLDSEDLPSLISSGKDAFFHVDELNNNFSTLASTGNMFISGTNVSNSAIKLQRHYQVRSGAKEWHNFHHDPEKNWRPSNNNYTSWTPTTVDLLDEQGNTQTANGFIVAGGNISFELLEDLKNSTIVVEGATPQFDTATGKLKDPTASEDQTTPTDPSTNEDTDTQTPDPAYVTWDTNETARTINTINERTLVLLTRHNGLFSVNTDPNHPYLIETRSPFNSAKDTLGSDYLTNRLNLTPDITQRRLGDSYYETTLIRDAIIAATGMRFLDPAFESDQEQFAWLMDNAYAAAESMQLAVGVSLTADQINQLQQDIIWMEEQEVAGIKVLVPVLYLTPGSTNLANQGAVISANQSISINANGVANTGAVIAKKDISINADGHGVVNLNGVIQSGGVTYIESVGDIKNQSGIIQGQQVGLYSQGDIINQAWAEQTNQEWDNGTYVLTQRGKAGLIEGKGNVVLDANNIAVVGATVKGETVALNAQNDIYISSLASGSQFDGYDGRAKYTSEQVYQLASSIEASLNLFATAENNIDIVGSTLSAGQNMKLLAQKGNINIKSAESKSNSDYQYKDSKDKQTRKNTNIKQQKSTLIAGGQLDIDALEGDLMVQASDLTSVGDMSLYAKGKLSLTAAIDQTLNERSSKHKGSYGSKSARATSNQSATTVSTTLTTEGNLTLKSEGDQQYNAAKLNAKNDLTIDTDGRVTFKMMQDLTASSHTSSSGNLAWVEAEGKGNIKGTLQQTQMNYGGKLNYRANGGTTIQIEDLPADIAIDAANSKNPDAYKAMVTKYSNAAAIATQNNNKKIDQVTSRTVSETIDIMVANDPSLSWIKELDKQGEIDWERVKATQESWSYSTQSMGPATALAVAIVVTAATGGAGAAITGAQTGLATTVTSAVVSGAAVQGTSALINNQGNLSNALDDLDHSNTYKSLAISGVTAGVMHGVDKGFNHYGFSVENDPINQITHGFELNTVSGTAGFAGYNTLQAAVSAGVSSTVYGTSFNDAFKVQLNQAGIDTLTAVTFNAAGDLSNHLIKNSHTSTGINLWNEGGAGKVALHAAIGGGIGYLNNHDFAAGAAAAGLNELLSPTLSNLLGDSGKYRNAGSQITGLIGAIATDGDVNVGAYIAKYADTYNRQLHQEEFAEARRLAKQYAAENPGMTEKQAFNELLLENMRAKDATNSKTIKPNFNARWFLARQIAAGNVSSDFNLAPDEYYNDPFYNGRELWDLEGTQSNLTYWALQDGIQQGTVTPEALYVYQMVMGAEANISSNRLAQDAMTIPAVIYGLPLLAPSLETAIAFTPELAAKTSSFLATTKGASVAMGAATGAFTGYQAGGWEGAVWGGVVGTGVGFWGLGGSLVQKGVWSAGAGVSFDAGTTALTTTIGSNYLSSNPWYENVVRNTTIATVIPWVSGEALAAQVIHKTNSVGVGYFLNAKSWIESEALNTVVEASAEKEK